MTDDQVAKPDVQHRVSRRNLLLGSGALAAAGAVAAIPLSRPPYPGDYPLVPGNKVDLPPNGKTVVILGGGLSGLQAGVELSSRGFKVVILEKTGSPGGKLKTWRDKGFGPPDDPAKQMPEFKGYVRDHGLHAVWGFYNNLREFVHRHGWALQKMPEDLSIYTFLDKDGTKSHIPVSTWPAPYNLIHQLLSMQDINHVAPDDRGQLAHFFRKLAAFDYTDAQQRDYMDSMTVAQYGRAAGLSEGAIKILDSLVEMAYFSGAHETSALTIANLTQLVAGSPRDLRINPYVSPPGETFLQPMVEHILAHGGEIHYNTEVSGLEMAGGRLDQVIAAKLESEGPIRRCAICGAIIMGDHEVGECPYCGARGDMIRRLSADERAERRFRGDYYVMAMDIPAAQQFIGAHIETLGNSTYFRNILDLHATHVYIVDFWFEGTDFWLKGITDTQGRPAMDFFATGYNCLGITINWTFPFAAVGGDDTMLMPDYMGRNVSIIETQVAKAEYYADVSNAVLAELCYQELKTTIPDIPPYKDFFVNRWRHYTGYQPGDEAKRPPLQSPIENLFVIGDMSFVPHPAVFMEKTNVTAKWVTNLLLDKIGQSAGHIQILPSGTPSLLVDVARKLGSVYI